MGQHPESSKKGTFCKVLPWCLKIILFLDKNFQINSFLLRVFSNSNRFLTFHSPSIFLNFWNSFLYGINTAINIWQPLRNFMSPSSVFGFMQTSSWIRYQEWLEKFYRFRWCFVLSVSNFKSFDLFRVCQINFK